MTTITPNQIRILVEISGDRLSVLRNRVNLPYQIFNSEMEELFALGLVKIENKYIYTLTQVGENVVCDIIEYHKSMGYDISVRSNYSHITSYISPRLLD